MNISNISVAYGTKILFEEFSQNFDTRWLLLTGPSGCGKTTLLKEIFKQLQSSSTADNSIFILQEDALLPWSTASENILNFCRANNPKVTEEHIKNHKLYYLIADLLHKPAWTMSFGERRTVELFRAFVAKPEILILDEPFNFLDPKRREVLADYLFSDDLGLQELIITTHEIEDFKNTGMAHYEFPTSLPIEKLNYVRKL